MVKASSVTIEFDAANRNVYFPPADRVLRGRFDFARAGSASARALAARWPAIPGQRLTLDVASQQATIHEPLRDDEFASIREQIERSGKTVGKSETLDAVDVPTLAHYIQRAVDAGQARIVAGEIPTVEGTVRHDFIVSDRQDSTLQLATVLGHLARVLERIAK